MEGAPGAESFEFASKAVATDGAAGGAGSALKMRAARSGSECDRVGPFGLVGDESRSMSGLSGERFGGDACVTRRVGERSGDQSVAEADAEAEAAADCKPEAE